MNILKVFPTYSKKTLIVIVILGVINSAVFSGILIIINHSVAHTPFPFSQYGWLVYGTLIVCSLLTGKTFHTYMIKLSQDALFNVEVSLLQKLRLAIYQDFEKIGEERVYTAISDAKMLAQVPEVLLGVFNAAVMVLCGLAYMFWISPLGGISLCVLMGLLLVMYLARNKNIERNLNKVRDLQNHYYVYLRDLLFGFRELKMSIPRNETIYHQYLYANRQQGRILSVKTNIQYLNNELLGSLSWYVLLGLILFGLPKLTALNASQIATFVIVTLYMMGPVSTLITFLPFLTRTKIAIERIEELERNINSHVIVNKQFDDLSGKVGEFSQISFSNVVFEFTKKGTEDAFKVGPLNLELFSGETVFITGSNGSGKSTFMNLLAGLYLPSQGKILLNGAETGLHNAPFYSNHFSAIFTNNYLFQENYDRFELHPSNKELMMLVELMELSDIIKFDPQRGNLGVKYSKGQQKRLAMIYAILESRNVILLDEWAAEQDPHFRACFYHKLLPLLKEQGRTIIAVTHDEAYYSTPDRIIRFDSGRIVSDQYIRTKVPGHRIIAEP